MKSLNYINLCILLYISVFFFSACESPEDAISPAINNIPTALILYASDTPSQLPYFSTFFTDRINKEGIYLALHDNKVNQAWLKNAQTQKMNNNIEATIKEMKDNLKYYYKKEMYDKLISNHLEYENKVYTLLADNPMEINTHLLSEFFFWNTVAAIKNKQNFINSSLFYQKYASLAEKNLFESEVESDMLNKLQKSEDNQQKSITIISKNKCLIYINGNQIKNHIVTLPLNLKCVLSALCPEGNFSKIFIPTKLSGIVIDKFTASTQANSMPNLEALPKQQILQENVKHLILIFWSKKLNIVEAKLLDAKNFTELKNIILPVKLQKEFDTAGDKLIHFFKK